MKIGIVLHPYSEKNPAGLGRFILELSRSLVDASLKDEFILYVKGDPTAPAFVDGKRVQKVSLGSSFFWLERLRQAPRSDVYIFNTPVMPLLWRPDRSIVVALDFAYLLFPAKSVKEFFSRRVLRFYHALALRRSTAVISISEATKLDTVKLFGTETEKIRVVYPGFNSIGKLTPQNISVPENFFLFVGVIKERKNVFTIVKAYELFQKNNPGIDLVIAGKKTGTYFEEISAYVRERGLENKIHFIGFISDNELSFLYQKAQALVFPSIVEGFGFPILEAMDVGLPVITSKSSSLGEIAADAALTVSPKSKEEIAEAMQQMWNNSQVRATCIDRGRARATLFTWSGCAGKMLAVVRELHH